MVGTDPPGSTGEITSCARTCVAHPGTAESRCCAIARRWARIITLTSAVARLQTNDAPRRPEPLPGESGFSARVATQTRHDTQGENVERLDGLEGVAPPA